jgi:multiple sugar transport system substrate-binding protein
LTNEELLSLLDLLERVHAAQQARLPLLQPDPVWNMIVFLTRRHLTGKLVTPTSLANAAGVPYTTAVRRIEEMFKAELLVRRPRTRSGLSHAVYPSQQMLDLISTCGREIKAAIAGALGERGDPSSFYLGTSYLSARIIPPPSVMPAGLGPEDRLSVLLFNDPSFFVDQELKAALGRLLGGQVLFEGCLLDELRLRTLANASRQRSEFDIVAVDLPWMGEFATRNVLLPLDDLICQSAINRADFHPAEWAAGHAFGHQYSIPLQTNPEILFCRRDMLAARGLAPPSTVEELLTTARELHAPRERIFGVSWAGARGVPVGYAFMMFLADFGQPLLNLRKTPDGFDATHVRGEEYRPRIDTPAGRRTAQFMLELLEVSPPDVLETAWADQIERFSQGHVAMAYEWAIRAARFELDPASPARGNVVFVPHPVGGSGGNGMVRNPVCAIGGFALGIPANIDPARTGLAWRVIEWLTSPEVMKLFVLHGGHCTPRFSVAADHDVRRLSPVITAVDKMAKQGQLHLWPRPPVPEFAAIAGILGEEIHSMLRREQSVGAALRRAQDRVDRLMHAHDRY